MTKSTKVFCISEKRPNKKKLEYCANLIRKGKLVVFPSETVYGLGANALSKNAVQSIYKAKGRPTDNPLIVHVSSIKMAEKLVLEIPAIVRKAMGTFWPGPITFVLKKKKIVPSQVTCGLDTVGIRFPSNRIARRLIEISDRPIAAPSANLSGKPSPTKAKHVIEDLNGRVDAIINGGNASVGLESTVIDVSGDLPILLRPGGITLEELEKVFGVIDIADSNAKSPKCPGMKYRHYAPNAVFYLFDGKNENPKMNRLKLKFNSLRKKGYKVAIIASKESKKIINEKYHDDVFVVGSRTNLLFLASKIFNVLRKIDRKGYDYILMTTCPNDGIGRAIMNRIRKAATKVIN